MANKFSYCPIVFTLLWAFFAFTGILSSQDCGCINCPVDILDQAISTATFKVDGAADNSLTSNAIQSVHLKFNHSFPSELEMKLISPAGQAVTLIGPQGTSASAVFFGGFNVSFVTDINATDPDPGMNNIWNNADLSGIQQYSGSYLPFSGSLLNFNTGTVNGDWLLDITDPLLFDDGILVEFEIVFIDQDGIECCQADAGELDVAMLTACQGEEQLLLSINPIHNNGVPNNSNYGYTYIITENDVIIEITENPDLRTFVSGGYSVYGFSFDLLDEAQIPSPNSSLTLTDLATNIEGNNPIICGDITNEFLDIVILGSALETFVSDTICEGESIFFGGEEIFVEGTYRDTFNTLTSCDSIAQLDLVVGAKDTVEIFESTCTQSLVGVDTIILTNDFGCDSLVVINISLLPSDTVFLETQTCELAQDMLVDTLTIATPECDSIIITTLVYEAPDTVYAVNKSCFPQAIGLDTSFINQGGLCDDVEITETILYLIDTTVLDLTTCDEDQVGESIMTFPTDTCDRVEISIFRFVAADTTFLTRNNCNQALAGVDTLFLTNEENCDSLVITTTSYVESDTLFFEFFSCDALDIGADTIFLSNQFMCDSLIINTTLLSASDSTFILEKTCDLNQTDPVIGVFLTEACDSIVITEFEFVEPDTTFIVEQVCEEINSDTLLLQNFQGCDSLVITTFENASPEITLIEEDTCDPLIEGPKMDTLMGEFCDSIIITNFNFLPSSMTNEIKSVCSIEEAGTDTLILANVNGCDSLIITECVFEELPPTLNSSFTCDENTLGLDTLILNSSTGCDSLVITEFVLAEADTVFTETSFTCDVAQVGFDTLVFATSTCDSVVITPIAFEPLPITMRLLGDCSLTMPALDTIILVSEAGCDSTIIITTLPLASSLTITNVPVTSPLEVGMDTMFLQNAVGCDSLVVTNFLLETEVPDTIYVDVPTCDFDTEPDTIIGISEEVIIEVPIPILIDTTFLEGQVCNESIIENDTSVLNSNLGCDSVVVTSFLQLNPSITNISQSTCDQGQSPIDTLFLENQFGCDSLVVTNYEIVIIEPTFISETSCDPNQELIETIILDSEKGCDSLVMISYELVDIDTVFNVLPACSEMPSDTIMIDGAECPTVEITLFENLSSDTTFLRFEKCVGPFGVEVFQFVNESGCDSVVMQTTNEALQNETIIQQNTCDENQVNDTLFLAGQFCDSLVITNFIFGTQEPTILELFTCDENQVNDTLVLAGQFCDSVVITNFIFGTQEPTILELFTCDENQVSDTLVLEGQFCDSVVITNFIFGTQEPTILETLTCDANDVLTDTIVLANSQQCDSLVITKKVLVEISPTEIFSTTCIASEEGIFRDTLTSYLGCDSLRIETIDFVDQEETFLQEFTCDEEEVGLDTTIINDVDCPSLIIIETILQEQSEPNFIEESTCDQSLIGESQTDVFVDRNGCDSIVVTSYIFENLNLDFDVSVASPFCTGEANGVVSLDVEDGVEVLWLFDQGEEINRGDLPAGEYQVQLSENRCDSIIQIIVPATPPISLNLEVDNVLCSSTGGVIFVQAFGGQGPFEYLWQDMSTDSVRTNLPNGVYFLTVTDAKGCTIVDSTQISNALGLDFETDVEGVSCFGETDGVIHVLVLSGTPPYIIEWQDGNEDLIRNDLAPGIYSGTVNDANDCSIALNRVVSEPPILEVDFQINNAGDFEAQVAGGTPPYSYAWNDGNTTPVIREPVLGFGYEVTVTDANDCVAFRDEVFAQVSISTIEATDAVLFPNPNKGVFQITFDASLDLKQILIYNIYGQVIPFQVNIVDTNAVEIVLPPAKKGAFIIDAKFEQGQFLQKVMVF